VWAQDNTFKDIANTSKPNMKLKFSHPRVTFAQNLFSTDLASIYRSLSLPMKPHVAVLFLSLNEFRISGNLVYIDLK
jgi:hypothetical protein